MVPTYNATTLSFVTGLDQGKVIFQTLQNDIASVLDVSNIYLSLYISWFVICGNMEYMGWVVVKSIPLEKHQIEII